MQYGLYVPCYGAYGDPHNLLTLAMEAEAAGWEGFFLWDTILRFPQAEFPFVDAGVALAAIATQTKRLRLGPMVTPLARRRPGKLTREIVCGGMALAAAIAAMLMTMGGAGEATGSAPVPGMVPLADTGNLQADRELTANTLSASAAIRSTRPMPAVA